MLDFQKLVGSGPMQPVWLVAAPMLSRNISYNLSEMNFFHSFPLIRYVFYIDVVNVRNRNKER